MADDVGWFNIGVYNQGMMGGITTNLDKLAENGMRFTDYYAEPSCTAGRANFITGELPMRTGLTSVGQTGSDIGMPAEAPTIATVLKSMGYATGQFGKNHLGDLNKFLPTVHGFEEFFGYLYHLDAMEDPYWHSYPEELNLIVGPRNMIHSWATDVDDKTVDKRWGKVGMQKVEDAGGLPPERMKTVDDEILKFTFDFMDKAQDDEKPFFVWLNPTRMHVITHLSDKYEKLMTPENGWYTQEAGMVQLDDIVGEVMDYLETNNLTDNTILVFTTDNGAEVFTWPDGGLTPFAGAKGMILEGGMRVPMIVQWPGHIEAGKIENGLMSGLDFFPTLVRIAGNPNIVEELKKGKTIDGTTYKVHLDGYDQTDMLTNNGPSTRHEIYYFAENTMGAIRVDDYKYRFIDQPDGWFGSTVKLDMPSVVNLRLDPLESVMLPEGFHGSRMYFNDFFEHEFWRTAIAKKQMAVLEESAIEFPPMQEGSSFNLESAKKALNKPKPTGN
jgi:arylsulfatase